MRFKGREHVITAEVPRLKEAREFAEAAAAAFGLSEQACHDVKLAMSEAVTNAIKHGSSSPRDRIELEAVEEAGALVFYVRDSGRFVPRVRPRGRFPMHGRGLAFVSRLMDEVDLRPGRTGTVLRFAKSRG